MTPLTVPHDDLAERQLAGGVVSNPVHGIGLELVTAADFYAPALGRVFGLRPVLADVRHVDERIALAAQHSGLELAEVAQLVHDTVVVIGFAPFAARVAEAARARQVMAAAAEIFNAIGAGAGLDAVASQLRAIAAA